MYELISANKRRSWILIIAFSVVILLLGWLLSYTSNNGSLFLIYAIIINVVMVITSYYSGDKLVLASVRAQKVNKSDDPELFLIVENLAIASGIPTPQVYLIPDAALNAFATGRDPEHASVAITVGLRQLLTKTELEAVMAHELSHIKNYDIRVMLLAGVLLGVIVFLSDFLMRSMFYSKRSRDNNNGALILIPIAILSAILAPLIGQMIKFAISRKREYLADASGVMLTRYPEAMISALQKISQRPALTGKHEAIAHMFIFPPFKKSSWAKLFSTHPPIEDRINSIKEAARIRS